MRWGRIVLRRRRYRGGRCLFGEWGICIVLDVEGEVEGERFAAGAQARTEGEGAGGVAAGGDEAGEDGIGVGVFGAGEENVGGREAASGGGGVGPGEGGGDAGGDVGGEEGFTDFGLAGEEGELAAGEARGPEPVEG